MHPAWSALLAAAALSATAAVAATSPADCRARSADHATALIELYTSEGCDSCPPADRWLSTLTRESLGDRAVALALHVDYWDRLGWKDRFARPEFTARQREESARGGGTFVYTPQVLLQGRDFPRWQSGGLQDALATINARPARAKLELDLHPRDGIADVDLRVQVPDPGDRAQAAVAVALVQSGLASDVKAGENAGKRLRHDRVVRQWRSGITLDASGTAARKWSFALPADAGPLSIVAVAEDTRSGEVLQTLELPFCAAR